MHFARPLFVFIVCLCCLGQQATVSLAEELAGSRPNVILVMTDDQGYPPVGRHGHPWIETPNLDSLYDQSTRFTRFLVSPTCSPTRSALMTGRHPLKNGITHTILERERLTLDATILPQILKQAGYTSGIFGKWHLGDEEPYQPHQRGFDETFIHGAGGIGQAYDCSCADAPDNSYFDPVIRHNGSFVKTEGFCTDVFFTAAMGWIREQEALNKPFFAYIATNAPHGPFLAPEEDKQRFLDMGFSQETAGFYGMVENIDDNIGRLITMLDSSGLSENTLVIFMSDNGMTGHGAGPGNKPLGETASGKELFLYNAEMKGLKGSPHEGGVRVPFFVRWPGHIKAGAEVDRIAAHIDLLPTLAALTGASLPQGQVEGRNLLPLMEDPQREWSDRYLFTHVARWPKGDEPNEYQWKNFAVRNQRYRFVNNSELYDIQNDPGETNNIIDQHPEVVKEMRKAYDEFWQAARPLMVNEQTPNSDTRPFHVLYKRQQETTGIPQWDPPALQN
ncbi:MAG: arylsulfatase [Planctomyces sp.]|nr:arylsulfatase [Planctomyces sp.]